MLLTVDVGNTNIVFGVYRDNELIKNWRMSTDKSKTADELGIFLKQLLIHDNLDIEDIEDVIISSVVPTIMYSLQHMTLKYFDKEAMVVGPGIKTGMKILYDDPKQVGADRIVNGVAAIKKYGGPIIVVDFGTATTFCGITEDMQYLGGAIAPGIKISSDALFQKAAKLTRVELQMPTRAIAKTTNESMQSGIIFGYVGLVDHMVRLFKDEMTGENIKVVATGGLSSLIASKSNEIDIVDKFLTLDGLKMIYDLNIKR
ncbi:MAG: type III pantothenate kinase [Clostridiales bacterium]|nr:type III pantothenate kinase [Clostridiales bacterium]